MKIDSKDGLIRAIPGRISTLTGLPCLCRRRRITTEGVSAEMLEAIEAQQKRKNAAVRATFPNFRGGEPAVVAFTARTTAFAIGEFLHRLTGFRGEDYNLSENLIRFDEGVIRKPGASKTPALAPTSH